MSRCVDISAYLDGRLEPDAAERFEAHVEGCAECRPKVDAWRTIAARIADVSNSDAAAAHPTTHEQLLLVQRAEMERDLPRHRGLRLALAASVLLALGVIAGYFLPAPSLPEPVGRDLADPADAQSVYRTDSRSRASVELGQDAIRLGPASRVRVLASGPNTRLALEQGSLACDVAERAEGRGFTVETESFTVRVTGTRFLVDLGSDAGRARVVVAAGAVEVRGSAATHSLGAGERLSLDEDAAVGEASNTELAEIDELFGGPVTVPEIAVAPDTEPPAEEPAPEEIEDGAPAAGGATPGGAGSTAREPEDLDASGLERWRGWVIEGRHDEARSALRGHLKAHPADAEAWSLLADCERKRGAWEDAVSAYDKVESLTGGEQANRARYKAAVLLQDRIGDQRRAAELLERFVEGGGSGWLLVGQARIRLARALVALGKPDGARAQLERVIASRADAETVATARQMLEKLDRK